MKVKAKAVSGRSPRPKSLTVKGSEEGATVAAFVELAHLVSPPPNVYVTLLGMEPRPVSELLEAVQQGFSYRAYDHFQQVVQLPAKDVAALLEIPPTTLVRRKASGQLGKNESERLLRFSRLFAAAIELFEGDVVAARRWLQTPAPALNRVAPLEMARTELGAREVEKLIERLEEGVYC